MAQNKTLLGSETGQSLLRNWLNRHEPSPTETKLASKIAQQAVKMQGKKPMPSR
jgi:hypothetical protein